MQVLNPTNLTPSLPTGKTFIEGPAGSGKTTHGTNYLLTLLESGVNPNRILVLIPQVTLGRPYQLALQAASLTGGTVSIQTLPALARDAVETYWPLINGQMKVADLTKEPTFLNIETAQYFMARFVAPAAEMGRFEGVSMDERHIIAQVLFNLDFAAIMHYPLDEIAQRLIAAWGPERDSMRPIVYNAALDLAHKFREYCLTHNLVDFSLLMEAFQSILMHEPLFTERFLRRYEYLIVDNVEESTYAVQQFIRWLMPHLRGALLLYDTDAGYRIFLGAEPDDAYDLHKLCDRHEKLTASHVMPPALEALDQALTSTLQTYTEQRFEISPLAAVQFTLHRYYPQMLKWVAERIIDLVNQGVAPRDIAVVAPYLNDSLRFFLSYELEQANIPIISHRPSRALRDEPATRSLITLALLACPDWGINPPSMLDVADALCQAIDGLDPVRARLLASIVYRANNVLGAFADINEEARARITYLVGERYEALRAWLLNFRQDAEDNGNPQPLDHCFSRLFGEILSQPGFGFHTNLEAGRVIAQLIASAQRFRQTLYGEHSPEWQAAGREYLSLLNQRLLSGLYAQNWQDESVDGVFIAPAFTFLMRNRFVDYQFWIDVGSNAWSERLEQPLTHPYVLQKSFPHLEFWSDEMEEDSQQAMLHKIAVGLVRRCRKQIFLGIADLGESGFESRGLLLHTIQDILRRYLPPGAIDISQPATMSSATTPTSESLVDQDADDNEGWPQ